LEVSTILGPDIEPTVGPWLYHQFETLGQFKLGNGILELLGLLASL
jgi:hypothetical protein